MPGIILRNGHVLDKHSGINDVADVWLEGGFVKRVRVHSHSHKAKDQHVGSAVETGNGCDDNDNDGDDNDDNDDDFESLDVSGCIVSPGLVDCHVHAYQHVTPLGMDLDQTCLARGVTTVADAGSSGAATFPGLRTFIRDRSKTRLFAFLHIAQQGLAAAGCAGLIPGGECDSLNAVQTDACHKVIQNNRDVIVGVKVRLAASLCDDGKNEQEVFRLGCPGSLRRGDIYTHCFHGHQANLLDPGTGRVPKAAWDAKKRGVVFDLGHGQGSFSWKVAEQCTSEGFWPDTISTDLHTESQRGPAYDLLTTMTKMLHLGMALDEVMAAVTCRPAAVIGKDKELGHLRVGARADVTVLRLLDLDPPIPLEDSFGLTRPMRKSFELVAVFAEGHPQPVHTLRPWPNPKTVQECQARGLQYKAPTEIPQ